MKYIDYIKNMIKMMAYDNIILFPIDKIVNKEIEELQEEENKVINIKKIKKVKNEDKTPV
jgi:flagellar motor component MotA